LTVTGELIVHSPMVPTVCAIVLFLSFQSDAV